jgi:hypothetical protein
MRCERGSLSVAFPIGSRDARQREGGNIRVIGLNVHRTFAVVAILEDNVLSSGGRVELTRDAVVAFGRKLRSNDEVVIEATRNTAMIVRLLRPFVQRVVSANPLQVRTIAHAKITTGKIDAAVLAKLHASRFLPEVWMPTKRLRPCGIPWRSALRSSNKRRG